MSALLRFFDIIIIFLFKYTYFYIFAFVQNTIVYVFVYCVPQCNQIARVSHLVSGVAAGE